MVLVECYRKVIYDHVNQFQGDGTMRFIKVQSTNSDLPPLNTIINNVSVQTLSGSFGDFYEQPLPVHLVQVLGRGLA